MTTDRKNEPVWFTPEQLDDHTKAFGRPGYDVGSGAVKERTEAHEAGVVKTLMAESFTEVP